MPWEQIKNSTSAWVVLSLIAIISLVWGLYSHFSNNKKKRFSVALSSYGIVKKGKSTIQNLELLYHGKRIEDLTISKFAIWNSGNKIINSSDIVSSEKLRISADNNGKILEAQIVAEVEPANSFVISNFSGESIDIDFDYVDSREGVVIQILHTGGQNSLCIDCKIKGGAPIKHYSAASKHKKKRLIRKFIPIRTSRKIIACGLFIDSLLLSLLTIVFLLSITGCIQYEPAFTDLSITEKIVFTTLFSVMDFLVFILSTTVLKLAFVIGVPSKLKTYTVYTGEDL